MNSFRVPLAEDLGACISKRLHCLWQCCGTNARSELVFQVIPEYLPFLSCVRGYKHYI